MANKFLKAGDRLASGKVPLCERDLSEPTEEERNKLKTVDDLFAACKGDLSDSIWAPVNEKRLIAKRQLSQQIKKGSTTQSYKMATPGGGMSSGLRSSRWGTTPQKPRAAPVINAPIPDTTSPFTANKEALRTASEVPPHLRTVLPKRSSAGASPAIIASNSYTTDKESTRDVSEIPPHLRAVMQKSVVYIPPHLRSIAHYSSRAGLSTSPEFPPSKNTHVVELVESATPNRQLPSSEPTIMFALGQNGAYNTGAKQEVNKQLPLYTVFEKAPVEEAWSRYLAEKTEKDVNAKRIAIAQKLQQSPAEARVTTTTYATPPTPWGEPRPARIMKDGRHPHFKETLGDQGVGNFQHFLKEKNQQVISGKRYISTLSNLVSEEPIQQPVAAAELLSNYVGDVPQVASKFTEFDPHAVFNPSNLQTGLHGWSTPQTSGTWNIQSSPLTENHLATHLEKSKLQVMLDPAPKQNTPTIFHSDAIYESNSAIALNSGSDGRWEDHSANKQNRQPHDQTILGELMAAKQARAGISQDVVLEGWGSVFSDQSVNSFEGKVSDSGIEEFSKENVRGAQGKGAAEELLDWDKSWLPPPCVWEDRGAFDTSFIPDYIRKDWQPNLAAGSVWFELDDPDFQLGRCIVNNKQLDVPLIHADTNADTKNSENEGKRIHQTAQIELMARVQKLHKNQKRSKAAGLAFEDRQMEAQAFVPVSNPFAPLLAIYLRPATLKDIPGIRDIYNYYVKNSIVTEDHAPVDDNAIREMLKICQQEKLPFIVAIKGKMPHALGKEPNFKGRTQGEASAFPKDENVVGFAIAQGFCYGLAGLRSGRSRTTVDIQLYVDVNFTRKGIGRCLLDQLTQCLSFAYAAKDGHSWVNPSDDPVYKPGGKQYLHQLIVQLTVLSKNDPNVEWISAFLRKYWYMDEGRIERVGRTSPDSELSEFLDVVFFCNEAMPAAEFNCLV